jgi:hypothetical protein
LHVDLGARLISKDYSVRFIHEHYHPFHVALNLLLSAFVSGFQALEASFFRREHVLQYPGRHMLDGDPPPKEEFVVEENVNFKRLTTVGAMSADDDTVPASSLPPPQKEAEHPGTLQ